MTALPPLDGVRVLDLTQALAGPFATMILGDLGADVIKIERPRLGDPTRRTPPHFVGDTSLYFHSNNRNKRSIELDLKSPSGREAFERLVERCDVLVHNYGADVAERLELTQERLHVLNPQLVIVASTGFGDRNRSVRRKAMDLVVQAMAGHISITGDDDGAPAKAAVPVVDLSVGLYMTIAVLTGLYRREAEGVGSYAETSLFHGGLSLLNYLAAYSMTAGEHLQRWGTAHPGSVPSQVFACVDGLVAVDASFDEHFRSLCGALEVPELADDPRFVDRKSRGENRRDLVARLAEEFGRRTADEVLALLAEIDIPCGPVLDVPAALAFADSLGYPAIAEFEVEGAPVKALATPIWFRGADQPRRSPPAIGADAISILTEVLGYDETMARETIVKQRSPAARSHEPSDEGLAGATAAHAQRD